MKTLRTLYMILAGIILLPVIVLVEAAFFIWVTIACVKIGEPEKILKVWFGYLKLGIDMNLDFIENGF